MSTTLFFLVPIGMLAVVWSFCFVGVCFPTSGISQPYSNTILQETNLIAYWPLSDLANSQPPTGAPALPPPPPGSAFAGTARDFKSNHNGTYINPPRYISGTTFLTTPGNPPVDLKPTLNLQQTSIVPGDAFKPGSKNLPACVDFEGGYVSIPWAAGSPSLSEFTFEAWVKPKWNSTVFNWDVFSARTNIGTGFVIHIAAINGQNHWVLNIGNGTVLQVFDTNVQAAVDGSLTYVAVTFASTNGTMGTLSLWINPTSSDEDTSVPPTADFTMQTTYMAVDQATPVTFFIGAGDNEDAQTPRTQDFGAGPPLVPYQGLIQSVALYDTALQPTDLASHFADGASSDT